MTYQRYAVYFVPDGVWGDFGAAWLGWDNRSGQTVPLLAPDHSVSTERPRKYGFHGTIKPPFRIAMGQTVDAIATDLNWLCQRRAPFELRSLQLSKIGKFFALSAPDENPELSDLSTEIACELDPFRAPLTEAELERRRAARLTPRQEELLNQLGYPYLLEEFRFHLTLTGPVSDPDSIQASLDTHLELPMRTPLIVDSLSLLGEAEDGTFHQLERFKFGGEPA